MSLEKRRIGEKEKHCRESGPKRHGLFFILSFLLIIYSVGIIQGIVEIKNRERIQFFDVFRDTFITPLKRHETVREKIDELQSRINSLSDSIEQYKSKDSSAREGDYGDMSYAAEGALYMSKEIKNEVVEINSHVEADTSFACVRKINELRGRIDTLYRLLRSEESLNRVSSALDSVNAGINRSRELYPDLSVLSIPVLWGESILKHTVFSREYLRGYEDELESESVAAETLRPYMQFYRYWFLKDAGDKAVAGESGWLFYRPGVQYLVKPGITDPRSVEVDPNNQPLTDDPVETIEKFKNSLEEYGLDLLVVIVPGKASVYPDRINRDFPVDSVCMFENTRAVIDSLRDRGIGVVDLYKPLRELRLKANEDGETVYLRKDTHWKPEALEKSARIVADRVKSYSWFGKTGVEQREYADAPVSVMRTGDVGKMTRLPDFSIRGINLSFGKESVSPRKVFEIKRGARDTAGISFNILSYPESLLKKIDDKYNVKNIIPYRDEYRDTDILILGDSFSRIYQSDPPRSAGWISHFSKEIGYPVASIVNDGGASTLVRETLARKKELLKGKKLCIYEFVERDLRYGAKGWKDIDF